MSIETTKSTKKKQAEADDLDPLDVTFIFLLSKMPEIADHADEFRRELRLMLGGERHYIKKRDASAKVSPEEILRAFNGRNASEVARRLGIGRATVYRFIKQPGRG